MNFRDGRGCGRRRGLLDRHGARATFFLIGQKAAQLCALNLLACLKLACEGDLDRVSRCLRVGGFVNCDPEFEFVPMVINGASDLFAAVLGEDGRHARTAVGVASLPRRAAVEVDAIFAVTD